jgi:hypothetical protein
LIHSFIDLIRNKIRSRILIPSREVEKVLLVFCIQEAGCGAWSSSFRTAKTRRYEGPPQERYGNYTNIYDNYESVF